MLNRKIFIIIIAALSITGCKKDPKDVAPVDQLDDITYPKTIADLETFLVPGYANFRTAVLYGFEMLPMNVLCSDHTACMAAGGETYGSKDLATNNIALGNNPNAGLWSGLYIGVHHMNVFLDRANYYQNTYGNKAAVDPMRAQAYFLRAYYYFQLECFYGEKYVDLTQAEDKNILGVPVHTTAATTIPETQKQRSTAYAVWQQIISDLEKSIESFQNAPPYGANERGKATIWSAKALLGKAYVFTQQWDKASETLADVINNSGKSLMPFSKYRMAFNGDPANEFNEESLFEINVDRQLGYNGIFSIPQGQSLTTSQGLLWSPSVLGWSGQENGDASSLNLGGRCQYFVHDKNLRRFGFNLPIYTLVPNPDHVDGTRSNAITPALIMDETSRQNSLNVRISKTVDPRLYVSALQPWVDTVLNPNGVAGSANQNGGIPQANEKIPVSRFYNIPFKDTYWGWSFRKYTTIDNSIGDVYGNTDAANYYLIRLADVYLLYAEARLHIGGPADQQGLLYLNKVHQRAYDGAAAFDYTSINSQATLADPADVSLANNPLAYERHSELFAEGGWWFDVCRWQIGVNEANYYVTGTSEDPAPNASPSLGIINTSNWANGKAYCYPIPIQEISANPSIQRNNPNY